MLMAIATGIRTITRVVNWRATQRRSKPISPALLMRNAARSDERVPRPDSLPGLRPVRHSELVGSRPRPPARATACATAATAFATAAAWAGGSKLAGFTSDQHVATAKGGVRPG